MCWVNTGGGQLPYSKYFANIRKQLIWGNKYIKVKGQSLRFNNWIESNLIYINDLLVEKEKISQEIKVQSKLDFRILYFKKGIIKRMG
jgi:hypothetical protein